MKILKIFHKKVFIFMACSWKVANGPETHLKTQNRKKCLLNCQYCMLPQLIKRNKMKLINHNSIFALFINIQKEQIDISFSELNFLVKVKIILLNLKGSGSHKWKLRGVALLCQTE